jgi:hypothetical protein
LSAANSPEGLAINAAQLPVPATPDSLASAASATSFVDSGGTQPNPFASLSRTALTAIIYNESGQYAVNQRLAASAQQGNNDSAFLMAASNRSIATGNDSFVYSALLALDQHKLPVEKALPSDLAPLATTTAQLVALVNQYGGTAGDLSDYPAAGALEPGVLNLVRTGTHSDLF